MRSYLSLIPISAKVRKRQSRMMVLCIIISVLLVTTIFSAADMILRGESVTMQQKHGNWHIRLTNISQDIGGGKNQSAVVTEDGGGGEIKSLFNKRRFICVEKSNIY